MGFSISFIFGSLIFGALGFIAFRVGKKDANIPLVMIGICMMIYGYFMPDAVWNWAAGSGLALAAYRFRY